MCSQRGRPYFNPSWDSPAKFDVESGRVLRLRPGRTASLPGQVLGRDQLYEYWRMKVSKCKVLYRHNQFTLRVTFVISEDLLLSSWNRLCKHYIENLSSHLSYRNWCAIPLSNAIADVVAIASLCASLTTGLRILNGDRSNERRAQTDD